MAFEQQKLQLVAGLASVAESMRKCAEVADAFAALVNGEVSADSPAVHVLRDLTVAIDDKTGSKRKRKGDATDDADAPKRRKRKPKDPNAPKRFASSYIFFQNEVRKELKASHPNMSNNELLGLISKQWQTLSEEEKAVYHQAMADAKERYSQDKRAYDSRNAEEAEAANAAAVVAAPIKKVRRSTKAAPAELKAGPAAVEKRVVALALPSSEASEASVSEESDEDHDDEHVSTSSGEEVSKLGRKGKSQPSVTPVTSGMMEKKKKVKA
ncbi:hypothetical protein APHAL10511_005586 [Amanita phalloides]|nr:hypothetical protein APHAL10511_005586 [Amanita phalloides]